MSHVILPAVWLIVLIVGLPQLSETVYSPSMPDISRALQTSEAMVEYTLTIYLFGLAIGTLFWGKLSDRIGRKPCVLLGIFIFILGCLGCYFSNNITALMISRLIQAFGGGIGSVLGQSILRDAYYGPSLGKVYAVAGSALAVFPAIGPVVGGVIAEHFTWSDIFLFLMIFAIFLGIFVMWFLPETHHKDKRKAIVMSEVAILLLKDYKVIAFGLIVAAANGISFSYFAEGSFYLIEILGLSPSEYGFSFVIIAASMMLGGAWSRRLHNVTTGKTIMGYGLLIMFIASAVFSGFALWHSTISAFSQTWMIVITIVAQLAIMFGVCVATSNALALALVNYQWCIGTATSLFGFFYYCLISLFTLGMGMLHNGTLLPMPLYFLGLSIFMLCIRKFMLQNKSVTSQ